MELLMLCRSCMGEVASWEVQNFDKNALKMFTFCTNIEVSSEVSSPRLRQCVLGLMSQDTTETPDKRIQVSIEDKLPKQFCSGCIIKIESSYIFIKKAQEVNVTLKNLISRKETSVIVKSDSLENSLKYNELNSFQSDSHLSSNVQIEENDKTMFASNANQNSENEMKVDYYFSKLHSPVNPEIEETLSNEETDLPEMRHNSNIEDFDTHLDRISNGSDSKKVQKIAVKKKTASNCARNQRHKKNKENETEVPELSRKMCSITTDSQELKPCEKIKDHSNGEEKRFKCDSCKISYKFNTGLQKHLSRKHSEATKEKHEMKPQAQEEIEANIDLDVKWNQTCPSSTWLPKHYKIHHSEAGVQYFCPHCPKILTAKRSYYHHMQSHAEYRQFACGECGARFRLGKQLAAHATTHAHARPHVCTKCGMAFKIKSILTNHMKSHSEEKPHLCSICGFSSKCAFSLKSHMLAHKGQKPFSCKECSFQTTYRGSLRLHQLRHRGERRQGCQHCGKRFYEKSSLDKHMRQVHTGERPFQCYLCASAFADGWKCKTHIMRAHGIPLEEIPRIRKHQPPKQTVTDPV